jgi:multicomponent Na+:H+ antiporter subunit C
VEAVVAILVGVLFAGSIYLMLSRNLVHYLLGLVLIGNAANLLIFSAGGLTRGEPALVGSGLEKPDVAIANPLPQALILTAIVIGFGLLAFALVLAYRAYETLDTVDTDAMRVAEPPAQSGAAAGPAAAASAPDRRRNAA